MFYFFFALSLFLSSVITHINYCRKAGKTGLQAKAFVFISIISLGIFITGIIIIQHSGILDPHSLWGLPMGISAGIIFSLLVPIYLCFYVLTQLTSPSKKILLAITQAGRLSYGDILMAVEKEDFIMTRLNDLCASGCVKQTNGRYILTWEGQKIAVTLELMQLALGREMGG